MSLSVRRLLGGALAAGVPLVLLAAGLPAAHADDVGAHGDELNGNTATLDLGAVCPGASRSGTVGFTLERRSNGASVWANSTVVTITTGGVTSGFGTVTGTPASATTPADWVTATTGNADNGKTAVGTSSTVTVAVPTSAPVGAESTAIVTFTGRGAGYGGGQVSRSDDVLVSWTVARGCTPPDSTPPVISYTLDATPTEHGWFAGPVAIDWSVTDPESPVVTTGCADAVQAEETDGHTFTCSARSAGGQAGPVAVTVKVDRTAPSVAPTVSGPTGANGWYTGDALLHWDVSDTLSGLVDENACPDVPITTDQPETTYGCTVEDRAGHRTTVTTTVKRDASAPLVSRTVTGTAGAHGWYTSPVDVDWTVSEGTSTPVTTTGCDDTTVLDTPGTTLSCVATNDAGLSVTGEPVELKVDTVPPVVSAQVAGDLGDNGWYVGPVTVDWQVTEDGSGVTEPCASAAQQDDTTGTEHTCTVTDEAGNTSAPVSVTVRKDTTAPVVTHTVTGTPGDDGWFTSDVDVDFSVDDATSGVASSTGCDPEPLTVDTAGATYTCSATDAAGNTASDEATVKRDAHAPEVTWTGGPADGAVYDFGDPVPAAGCTATDETSGVTDAGCTVGGAGTAVGTHTLTASARDRAGNTTTLTRSYTVRAWTLVGFLRPVSMGEGVVNSVKAGSTVPLKFEVHRGGPTGPQVTSEVGAITMRRVACGGSDSTEPVTAIASTGGTALRYADGQWVQNWATPAGGKGSCYRVTLTTADGSSVAAGFLLT